VRWYDAIKSVSPRYMVVWNPVWANKGACQSGYASVLDLWPGSEFVDAAGPDQYDSIWCGQPAAYDEMDGEQPIGIGAWADWVIAQGVPFAVPEWGVDSGQYGNGDRVQFIRDMYAAFKKAYESPSGLAYRTWMEGRRTGAASRCSTTLVAGTRAPARSTSTCSESGRRNDEQPPAGSVVATDGQLLSAAVSRGPLVGWSRREVEEVAA
jgi:hypothetical protein